MNKCKGISMIALIITIIVIVILATISVDQGIKNLQVQKEMKVKVEKEEISKAISDRFISYVRNSDTYPLIGQDIDKTAALGLFSGSDEALLINAIPQEDEIYMRLIGNAEAQLLGIEKLTEENSYVVNYNTAKVYGPVEIAE